MNFKKTVLDNGIRLIVVPMKNSPTTTMVIGANVGSRYENEEINGISHFLEHLHFKGTNKNTSKEITLKLDQIGADYNAFTDFEKTAYWFRVSKNSFEKGAEILSDIYLGSIFPAEEIEKERGVILEEINMYEDDPARRLHDFIYEDLYPGTTFGMPIIGSKKNIKNLKREDFLNYKEKFYNGAATTVVIAGDITLAEAKKIVEKNLGTLRKGKLVKPSKVTDNLKSQIKLHYKKSDQTHLALVFRTVDLYDKKVPALDLLKGILSAGMSSRLFSKMREELGICYYSYAMNSYSFDVGLMGIFAGVANARLDEAIVGILEILKDIKENGVSEAELKKVKNMIVNKSKMKLENSEDFATFYVSQEIMLEKILKPSEVIKEITKVTAGDVQKMAQEFFNDNNLNLIVHGPQKDSKKIEKYLKI